MGFALNVAHLHDTWQKTANMQQHAWSVRVKDISLPSILDQHRGPKSHPRLQSMAGSKTPHHLQKSLLAAPKSVVVITVIDPALRFAWSTFTL